MAKKITDVYETSDLTLRLLKYRDTRDLFEEAEKETKLIYLFRNNPFEDFNNTKPVKMLEKAISNKRKLEFKYKNILMEEIKPLKIVYMEGNFYLACMTLTKRINNGFNFLRLSNITDIAISTYEYHETGEIIQAHRFLEEDFQTPFSGFDKKPIRAIVIVDKKETYRFTGREEARKC